MVAHSESSDDLMNSRSQSKKRRIPGACDICKKKKIRCDSGEMPGNRCSNCAHYGFDCTHREVTKTLGPAKGYVESLEIRLEKMDKLLAKLLPGIDTNQELDDLAEPNKCLELTPLPRNDDEFTLATQFHKLRLNPPQNRFFGKSSGYQLIQTALDLKKKYNGGGEKVVIGKSTVWGSKRPEFWNVPPWILTNPELEEDLPTYMFPDNDLMPALIDAYFVQINYFIPLLHRPTFEQSIANGLHTTDALFGGTVLLVCALGSRYSDNPQVFVENSNSTRSAGWRWFDQVQILRQSFYKKTSLYELQVLALSALFLQSTETPQGIWTQVGMAIRLAQEVGAHRKRSNMANLPSAEDELWKRAFWCLVSIDRVSSSFSGRPCCLQDEDFDLDLPVDCDDEYWEHDFKQPLGKPSTMAYFNCYLGLLDILAYAMRVIYAIKKPRKGLGRVVHRSEQHTIAELDSAMNNWMDSVPEHLQWNRNSKEELFLRQSAALYATYYYLQIFVHRPFIPSPSDSRPVVFPSLAICTNAARSCCHVLESYSRLSALPLPHLQVTAFTAAVILLLNIWSGKRSGAAPNPRREMEDVQRCMAMLKKSEERWSSAGRYWDILKELASAGDLSIPDVQLNLNATKKRSREEHSSVPTETLDHGPQDPHRSIAGSRRVSLSVSQPPQAYRIEEPLHFSLPMYSNELGRLPVHGQFNFSDTVETSSRNSIRSQLATHPDHTSFGDYENSNLSSPASQFGFDNLFSQANTFVQDTLFNSQTRGYSASYLPTPAAVDLSSIFVNNQFGYNQTPQGDTSSSVENNHELWSNAPTDFDIHELNDWTRMVPGVDGISQNQDMIMARYSNSHGEDLNSRNNHLS